MTAEAASRSPKRAEAGQLDFVVNPKLRSRRTLHAGGRGGALQGTARQHRRALLSKELLGTTPKASSQESW